MGGFFLSFTTITTPGVLILLLCYNPLDSVCVYRTYFHSDMTSYSILLFPLVR